ncbi:MAG: hypothetical protein AAF571_12000, partial [Verrucomicrobiota bacterium]
MNSNKIRLGQILVGLALLLRVPFDLIVRHLMIDPTSVETLKETLIPAMEILAISRTIALGMVIAGGLLWFY